MCAAAEVRKVGIIIMIKKGSLVNKDPKTPKTPKIPKTPKLENKDPHIFGGSKFMRSWLSMRLKVER